MPEIAIVTDSTSDIPAELAERYGITVVPLSVTIDGETYPDDVLTQAEFFERMNAAPKLPTTSQPPVGDFRAAYERLLDSAKEIVSIHIAPQLSGTIESAREAAGAFGERVHVVDSHQLSWSLAWQVIEGARAANEGRTLAEVVSAVESVRDRVALVVGLEKLDNLAKGGRIGKVAAFLGGMLNLRVMFHVEDGVFLPLARSRGTQAALREMEEWVASRMGERTKGAFCVLHAMAADRAETLRAALEERFEVVEMHIMEVGSVIATHTGVAWGVAFVPMD